MLEKYGMLEVPFHTQARANHPSGIAAKIVADLNLATHTEVLASEVLTYIVPELWLGDKDCVLGCSRTILLKVDSMSLPSEIGKAVELQALYTEDVVTGPDSSKLQGYILISLTDGLV